MTGTAPELADDPRAWVQVVNTIAEGLASGELKPCGLVPTYRDLARECNVSLNTVRKATRWLAEQGIIRRVHGIGNVFTAAITVPSGRLTATPPEPRTAIPGGRGDPRPWVRTAYAVLTRIAAGEYTGWLPAKLKLAADFGISDVTLTKALAPLAADGIIALFRGLGYRISPDGQERAKRLLAALDAAAPELDHRGRS